MKASDVVVESNWLWCVLETLDSWDDGIMLHVLDLETGMLSNEFFAAFDELKVLA